MRITDITSWARKKSKTNSSTYPDTDIVLYLKGLMPQFQADIEDINEDYRGSIEYRDLTATTSTGLDGEGKLVREYNLPADMINKMQNVYAKLDGENWIWLKPYREEDLKMPFEEDNILDRFSNEQGVAGYFIFRGSLMLLSGEIEEDVTGGLKIWDYAYSEDIDSIPTAGSETDYDLTYYGIPKSLHEMVATSLSIEWKVNQETEVPLTAKEQKHYAIYNNINRLKQLQGLNRGEDMSFGRPADGYDDGFNL